MYEGLENVDALYVTIKITSELYDCNHNCLTGVIKRFDPTFQTAMLPGDFTSLKVELRERFAGISLSQIDYDREDCRGILVILKYDGEDLKQQIIERFTKNFKGVTFHADTLKQQAIGELVAAVDRLMKTANEEFQKSVVRESARC